jgi:hypothetical protein
MIRRFLGATLALALALLATRPAIAQQTATPTVQAEPAPSSTIVTTAPNQVGVSRQVYFDYDLAEAKERSKRVRNALIGTSAVFGVGVILASAGWSQCEVIQRFNRSDELLCNRAGDVLLPLGGTFLAFGAIGMITTGIMLGVRNKQKRDIERQMRRHYYGTRFHWDTNSGHFVF